MSRHSRLTYLLFFGFLFLGVLSKEDKVFSQVDTTYIKAFPYQYAARVYTAQNSLSLVFEDAKSEETTFSPNNPVNLGLGFSWKNSSLSFGYGVISTREKERGKTKALDLQYHHYGERWVLDLYAQTSRGFYEESKQQIELYPDLKLSLYGAFAQYVFAGDKFSFSAAFNQNKQQLKSAGSWLLGGNVFYTRHRALPTLVSQEGDSDKWNFQLGPNGGYAYSWVFLPNFYFAGSLSIGMNLGFEKEREAEDYKLLFNPLLFGRFSVGYNAKTWSVNVSSLNTRVYVKYKSDYQTSLETTSFTLSFIKRFNLQRELPFLRKDIKLPFQ